MSRRPAVVRGPPIELGEQALLGPGEVDAHGSPGAKPDHVLSFRRRYPPLAEKLEEEGLQLALRRAGAGCTPVEQLEENPRPRPARPRELLRPPTEAGHGGETPSECALERPLDRIVAFHRPEIAEGAGGIGAPQP